MTARRLALLTLVASGLAGCQPTFREFISKEGNFAVKLPGTPKHETRTAKTMWGSVPLQVETARRGPVEFVAMYNDMPRMFGPWSSDAEWLGGAVGGAVEELGGTLKDRRDIRVHDHPGLEVVIDVPASKIPGGGRYEGRMIVVGQRLYRLAVVGPASQFPVESAREFLDSFALLDFHGQPIRPAGGSTTTPSAAPTTVDLPVLPPPTPAPAPPQFSGGSFARP